MATDNEFIDNISQISPNENVTDESVNTIASELQNNIKFVLNTLAASTSNVNNASENLLNYDNNGNKTSSTGGTFDTFENKNSWTAIEDNAVVNDTRIANTPLSLLIYSGLDSTIQGNNTSSSWIEREFVIPTVLRGSGFVFAIKGTGLTTVPSYSTESIEYSYCNSSHIPGISAVNISGGNTCFARYEDIVVVVNGAEKEVSVAGTLGPWPQFNNYVQSSNWNPAYRTYYVPFKVGANTESVKIKILRTRLDGAIAISNMLLIALPSPFESYNYKNIDINEFYDFQNNLLKYNSTTINGHHVASSYQNKLNEVLTKEQIIHLMAYTKHDIQYDWDQESGPRLVEIGNDTADSPKLNAFEFDPNSTRYLHFNMKTPGPNPGIACLSLTYAISENEFSEVITCDPSGIAYDSNSKYPALDCTQFDGNCDNSNINLRMPIDPNNYCKNIKFDVLYKTINPGESSIPNISEFTTVSYIVPIPKNLVTDGNIGTLEIYQDFFKDVKNNSRGSITLFTIARDSSSPLDTFQGNFLIGPTSLTVTTPPDDMPETGSYVIRPPEC